MVYTKLQVRRKCWLNNSLLHRLPSKYEMLARQELSPLREPCLMRFLPMLLKYLYRYHDSEFQCRAVCSRCVSIDWQEGQIGIILSQIAFRIQYQADGVGDDLASSPSFQALEEGSYERTSAPNSKILLHITIQRVKEVSK